MAKTVVAFAPGRVELLGNHTDYNEGVILSAAIDLGITLHGRAQGEGRITLRSTEMPGVVEADIARIAHSTQAPWADYPLGVAWSFLGEKFSLGGFVAEFSSAPPPGAGLSSSAANP